MERSLVIGFNTVYAIEATPEEKQLVNDLLTVWGKLEPTVGKNPALVRKGILFGLALQKEIKGGVIKLRPVRRKNKNQAKEETKPTGNE